MTRKNRWLMIGGVAVLMGLYAVGYLHRQGYCFSQSRFVTDEEVLVAAATAQYSGAVHEWQYHDPDNLARTRKKLAEDPECCRLLSGAEEDKYLEDYYDILDRFFGYASRIVLIKGGPESDPQYKSTWVVPISSCGLRNASTRSNFEKVSSSTTN